MSKVKVGFSPVLRHIAFAVLIRIEGAGVDIKIGVKLLDCDAKASCLQQFCKRSGYYALSERRSHATGNEYIFGAHGVQIYLF